MNEKMIFLSNSIDDISNDIIGFETYVNKLNDAIDEGAQMIAITSPFGSGKTSIIELLKQKRNAHDNEKFLKIQMWSELENVETTSKSCELHKNFLYQLGNALNPHKGTYINRRLSNNYGLLKLHVNKPIYWIFLIISMCCGIIALIMQQYKDAIINLFSISENIINYACPLLFLVAIVFLLIIVTRAEVIFSSKSSENQRIIEADEIIDLYRHEIIKKRGPVISWILKILNTIPKINKIGFLHEKRYIVIIEDLDRTDDGKAVIHFLKELRKYYLPVNYDEKSHKNEVVFIVNIKSESSVFEDAFCEVKDKYIEPQETKGDSEEILEEEQECESIQYLLYAKLFDYVLNLQTINIVDYDTILCGLLEKNKEYLNNHGLNSVSGKLSEIPGMQWIIRGENLDIREIKNRLNKAFVIYETLKERFPSIKNTIDFQKCAVAAYLTTEFELEFSKTNDVAFAHLIELDMQKKLTKEYIESYFEKISFEYATTIFDLIKANLIEDDYRMYFYNYPKNSTIHSVEESIVQKAILYNYEHKRLDYYSKEVIRSNSKIIEECFKKLKQLKLPLPDTVVKTELLFLSAIKNEFKMVIDKFLSIKVTDETLDKNISDVIYILLYDRNRNVYKEETIQQFCRAWEKTFSEVALIKLRETICKIFTREIMWYKSLFFGEHNVISLKEMENLSLTDAINLLNVDSVNFSISHVKYAIERFVEEQDFNQKLSLQIKKLLENALEHFDDDDVIDYCLKYMLVTKTIEPLFEKIAYNLLLVESSEDDENLDELSFERKNEIFDKYQEIINTIPINNLSDVTLYNINSIDDFENSCSYTSEIADLLYKKRYFLMSVLVRLCLGLAIDFNDKNIKESIQEDIIWLKKNAREFLQLRNRLLISAENIFDYMFCFGTDFPVLTRDEFELLINSPKVDAQNILEFFPAEIIDEDAVECITTYFNQKHVNNNNAFEFLKSLCKYEKKIVELFFKKIDFSSACCYYNFSKSKKIEIKTLFHDLLELNTVEGKMNFMEYTKFLDWDFEEELYDNLNEDMGKRYASIVRKKIKPNPVSSNTIKVLTSIGSYYAFDENVGVNETLFKDKEYEYYVVSTTLSRKKFVMDTEERLNLLWPVYVEMYSKSTGFSKTREYMKENKKFLEKMREQELYTTFSEDVLEPFTTIKQDSRLIEYVFTCNETFIIKYFYSLKAGFVDRDAAKMFLQQLENHIAVLKSDSVRYVVYDMLVDPGLKSQYTKIRKAYGCSF